MPPSIQFSEGRHRSRPVLQFLLVIAIALLCAAGSGAAQVDEVVAGTTGNAVLRGPWVTAPWRKPLPRMAVFTLGSFTYEKFVDHSGWNLNDFNQLLARYLVTEALVEIVPVPARVIHELLVGERPQREHRQKFVD